MKLKLKYFMLSQILFANTAKTDKFDVSALFISKTLQNYLADNDTYYYYNGYCNTIVKISIVKTTRIRMTWEV